MCHVHADAAVCICPKCEEGYAPVCGTDGLTYASDCYLKKAACRLDRNVNFGKDRACGMYCFRSFHVNSSPLLQILLFIS